MLIDTFSVIFQTPCPPGNLFLWLLQYVIRPSLGELPSSPEKMPRKAALYCSHYGK